MSEYDDVNVLRGRNTFGGVEAVEREVPTERARMGRSGVTIPRNQFRYDRFASAVAEPMRISVTVAACESDASASERLHRIHQLYGVDKVMDEQLGFFDDAFFLCYIMNSSSQLMPSERLNFYVGEDVFDFRTAMESLGIHARRFFRAYADVCYTIAKKLYDYPEQFGEDGHQMKENMIRRAREIGATRHPYLIFDVAEWAKLSDGEHATVALVKVATVGGTYNAVDSRKAAPVVRSLDNYDSSNFRSISNDNDITGFAR